MSGENILRTLIELLEAQEEIKVTCEIKDKEVMDEQRRFNKSTGAA